MCTLRAVVGGLADALAFREKALAKGWALERADRAWAWLVARRNARLTVGEVPE